MSIHTKGQYIKLNSTTNVNSFKNFFIFLFLILLLTITIGVLQFWQYNSENSIRFEKIQLKNIRSLPVIRIKETDPISKQRNPSCSHWDCFNIYKCGKTGHERISVYVYSLYQYVDDNQVTATDLMSKEYFTLLDVIINSKYYTANPKEACLFVPSIDTLNQERIRSNLTSKALQSLL